MMDHGPALRHALGAALCAALLAGLPTRDAAAAEPRLLGNFRDWSAFILEEASGPVCWMSSRPKRQEGEFAKRGDVFALVTHRPAERALDVVSFIAGYDFGSDSSVTVQVGKDSFTLFVDRDTAWAREDAVDRALSQAIRQGTVMTVRGVSARGTRTADTYSLAGTGAAYQAMSKACGVEGG